MKSLSISTKITIWYAVFMVILCSVLMTVVLQLYHLTEHSNAEMRLVRTVEDVSDSIVDEGDGFIFSDSIKYYVRDTYISVYETDGELVCGRRPRGFDEFPPLDLDNTTVLEDAGGNEWFVYDNVVNLSEGRTLYIRGMMNNEVYAGTDVFLMRVLGIMIPLLILLAAAGGWFITRRALSPLRHLIKVSSEIRSDADLSKRVQVPASNDEVKELAESFNGMFSRIEEVVDREKQFTSDVSHELRTPLAVIRSQSEYAMEDESYAPKAIEVINRESRRLSDLTSSLLMLARSDAGRLVPDMMSLDIASLIEGAVGQARISTEGRDIGIIFRNDAENTGTGEVWVSSDPALLIRVIMNLIDNAVKYGKSQEGRIEIGLRLEGNEAVVTIADDGPGIAREDREKVWQRFYRADVSRSDDDSSGLGLSMVSALTKAIGGSIRYVDEEERQEGALPGAIFELRLPLSDHEEADK